MKLSKIAFIFVTLFFGYAFSEGDASPSPRLVYCDLVGSTLDGNSSQVSVTVDYGSASSLTALRIKDDSAKVKQFNNMVEALNYMAGQGWELDRAFVVDSNLLGIKYHFLLKRKI